MDPDNLWHVRLACDHLMLLLSLTRDIWIQSNSYPEPEGESEGVKVPMQVYVEFSEILVSMTQTVGG